MANLSIGGLSSGIDYNALIDQMMQIARRPIALLQARQSSYKEKTSVYDELSTKLSALMTAAGNLRTEANFYVRKASASDTTIFDAAAASTAATGSYGVTVIWLAQAHRIASSGLAAETSTVGSSSGDFSFQVGSGSVTTVAVTAATTLQELRDAINAANGDAEASIINDGSLYRLVLTSKNPGAANAITVTANITALGFPSGPVVGGTTLQAAQNASFSIDGLPMTSSDNVIESAITGVSITFKKAGSATLSVTGDREAIRKQIEDFVGAYNGVVSHVSSNAYYDTSSNTSGTFTGESTARDVVTRLKTIVGTRVAGLPEDMRLLAQIGIKTGKDGTLSIDGTVLDAALSSDLSGVADLFTTTGGVANGIYDYIDDVTDSVSGALPLRTKGLQKIVTGITKDMEKIQTRLDKEEETLRRRFADLEAMIGKLSSQTSFLSSLLRY